MVGVVLVEVDAVMEMMIDDGGDADVMLLPGCIGRTASCKISKPLSQRYGVARPVQLGCRRPLHGLAQCTLGKSPQGTKEPL